MKTIVTLFLLFISLSLFSQTWENLTNKDWVYSIDENKNYLWIGTNGGLIKMHKQTKETITFNRADTGIPGNNVLAVKVDSNSVWLGSRHGGIGKFESGECEIFSSFNTHIPHDQYNSAFDVDSDGILYLGSLGYVSRFDGITFDVVKEMDKLIAFDNVEDIKIKENSVWMACYSGLYKYDGLNSYWFDEVKGNVGSIVFDESDNMWVSSSTGLYKFTNNYWSVFNTENSGIVKNNLYKMCLDLDNNLWIGASDYLICYTASGEWLNYECSSDEIGDFLIFTVFADSDNNLWIGTRKNGLFQFKNEKFEKVEYSVPSVLPHNSVNFKLANDKLWFGWDNGLFSLEEESFDTINSNLPYPDVSIRAADNEGNLWLTARKLNFTPQGVISDSKFLKFNGTDFIEYETPFNPAKQFIIEIDNNGIFWFGVNSRGLYKWDGSTWTNYDVENSPLTSDIINAIDFDSQGNIWIGLNGKWDDNDRLIGGGLMMFDGNETWQEYNVWNSELPYNSITALEVDNEDVIWLGTVNDYRYDGGGLTRFDGETWHSYNKSNSNISDNFINSIIEDSEGIVWCGTGFGGLVSFDKNNNWDIYMKNNSGIALDNVYSLVEKNNQIWMTHNVYSGVSVFNKEETSILVENFQDDAKIKIYPNPVTQELQIENHTGKKLSLKIIDITGSTIIEQPLNDVKSVINLDASSGVYSVLITDKMGQRMLERKIIKQ